MNREAIYSALFALVSSISADAEINTVSRRLKHWADVPANQRPALFMAQGAQTPAKPPANGLPTVWMLHASLYVYVSTSQLIGPDADLNPILDAITALFEPFPAGCPQTLGGLVQWARIDGTIETSEGTLGGDAVAIVPIAILTI